MRLGYSMKLLMTKWPRHQFQSLPSFPMSSSRASAVSGFAIRELSVQAHAGVSEDGSALTRDELDHIPNAVSLTRAELDQVRLKRLRHWFSQATRESTECARQYLRDLSICQGASESVLELALVWCNDSNYIRNYFFPVVYRRAGLTPGVRSHNMLIRQLVIEGCLESANDVIANDFVKLGLSPNTYTQHYISLNEKQLDVRRANALMRRPLFDKSPMPLFNKLLKNHVLKGRSLKIEWIKYALKWCMSYPEMLLVMQRVHSHVQGQIGDSRMALPRGYEDITRMLEERRVLEGWDDGMKAPSLSPISGNMAIDFGVSKRRIQHLKRLFTEDSFGGSEAALNFFGLMQQNGVANRAALNVVLQHCDSAQDMLRMLVYGWAVIGDRDVFRKDREDLSTADFPSILEKKCKLRRLEMPSYSYETVLNPDTGKDMHRCTCTVLGILGRSGLHTNESMAQADAAEVVLKSEWPMFNAFGMLESKCQLYGMDDPIFSIRTIEAESTCMYQCKCNANGMSTTGGIYADIFKAKADAAENALLEIEWPMDDGVNQAYQKSHPFLIESDRRTRAYNNAHAHLVREACIQNDGWKDAVDISSAISDAERNGRSLRDWTNSMGLVFDDTDERNPIIRFPDVPHPSRSLPSGAEKKSARLPNHEIHISSVNLICERFMLEGDYTMANECLVLLSCHGDSRTQRILNQTEGELNVRRNELMGKWIDIGTQQAIMRATKLQSQLIENGRMSVVWAKVGKGLNLPATDGRRHVGESVQLVDIAGPNEEVF